MGRILLQSMSFDSNNSKNDANAPKKSDRFSGFDYYRRKLFSPASSPPSTPLSHSPPNSQHQLAFQIPIVNLWILQKGSILQCQCIFCPVKSWSVIALRVYGPGQFASSQLSIQGDTGYMAAANLVTPVDETSLRQYEYTGLNNSKTYDKAMNYERHYDLTRPGKLSRVQINRPTCRLLYKFSKGKKPHED